ncbi:phosphoribosylaminoimidazolesuccinocarboxamide synthase [Marinitenerispora sediminis]|uniref:Phosphoribosylaminoimidazole-succinocarboxamide synthase n=1 Tax=Marinitenerispora sediminis TaxID=1931232 RepID=A0A368T7Y3_9ACTN|nr:phosphoribosylaminoimidazolesuccinocarboxamide synthase [Marinitenerispora sediminis]RCV51355.1 phosphoribosylaminoimidazolesuccinocarboxamide synthase [Marinitenerispora sediminis]RCV57183.1 phosphoribosylaminoimidazolesuccinocarboxamide synthase [Marinitenerispora sediminis]RCV60310.1 phosphoribosylaminoimidazolesuccinocarboxamide synthase [Marinitenerispora sediminis]
MSGFVEKPVPVEVPGLTHLHTGKVRDLYATADGRLVMVASDRVSAFDWVLPTEIPDKGRLLTRLSLWWFERLADLTDNHVVSDTPPPGAPADWAGRTLVCRRLDMVPVECVARGYLTGSGLAEYRATGEVCGVPLPGGLVDGSRLEQPIFTPATKAEVGEHDENVSYATVAARHGEALAAELRERTLAVYERGRAVAEERGILLADTKFEFGRDPGGRLVLADEVFTPDSSRFWPAESWEPGHAQPSFDKQYIRDWLTSPASGWDRAAEVPPPPLPDEVVARTRDKYVEAFERLTGGSPDLG